MLLDAGDELRRVQHLVDTPARDEHRRIDLKMILRRETISVGSESLNLRTVVRAVVVDLWHRGLPASRSRRGVLDCRQGHVRHGLRRSVGSVVTLRVHALERVGWIRRAEARGGHEDVGLGVRVVLGHRVPARAVLAVAGRAAIVVLGVFFEAAEATRTTTATYD